MTILVAGCGHAEIYRPYQAQVAVGAGIPGSPPDGLQIVRDASERYPPLISSCGGRNVHEVPLTDGMTSFHFTVPESRKTGILSCLKQKMPRLAYLDVAAY